MDHTIKKEEEKLSFSIKCFPPSHGRKEGAGHWLAVYGKAEELKNVNERIKKSSRKRENERWANIPHFNTLDRPFLLLLHCVDKPSDLCSLHISEQNLNSVKPEDLKEFNNVAFIDASINFLSLESFVSFVSLRELNLSLNGIKNTTFCAADFPHLQVLDLSYNSVSADCIVLIGQLPHLKVFHLTGNQLHHLPPNLGSSSSDATQISYQEEDTQFAALEVLALDDNRLSSDVFWSIGNLKRLKHLNLQGNHISGIPYLPTMGSSKRVQHFIEDVKHATNEPNTDERIKRISQIFHMYNWEDCRKQSGSILPLQELQFLNLADNKIEEEEGLMAVVLFPMIQEIDICSNPLTVRRRGDPPLLTHCLQERLGIIIKRKTTQRVAKMHLRVSADPQWEADDRISKKLSLKETHQHTQALKSEITLKRKAKCERIKGQDGVTREKMKHTFLTQVTDIPESDLQADEKNKEDEIPVQFRHHEILFDAKPIPNLGIQTAVRMLEQKLGNLNVYRDSKPKVDCIQRRYRRREKKIKELPPLKPMKHPAERVDEMLKEIRDSTTTREVPLSSVVHSVGDTRQEALLLLRDVKTKYQALHQKTMEQSDRNTNHVQML